MALLTFLLVAVGLPLVAWLIGSAILDWCGGLDAEERYIASWGVGIALFAGCQFVAFLLPVNQRAVNGSLLGLMVLGALYWKCRSGRQRIQIEPIPKPRVLLSCLAYVHLLCIQGFLPVYAGAGWCYDWWQHYDQALVFLRERAVSTTWGPYNITSRTPLYNLSEAFAMSLAGQHFWVYQIASVLLGTLVGLSLYLLLRDLVGRAAAALALLLVPLNIWILHNAWYTWPKMLSAYFALLGLHFYLRFVRSHLQDAARPAPYLSCSAASLMLGILTHPVVLVYALPLLFHLAFFCWRRGMSRSGWREVVVAVMLAAVLAAPWGSWVALRCGLRSAATGNPVTALDPEILKKPLHGVGIGVQNLRATVVPMQLRWNLQARSYGFPSLYAGVTELYFCLLTGALTLSLCALLVLLGARLCRLPPSPGVKGQTTPLRYWEWSAVVAFLTVGTMGAIGLHPAIDTKGIAHQACYISAILVAGLCWALLLKAPPLLAKVVCAGMLAEFFFMLWSHLPLVSSHRCSALIDYNWTIKSEHHLVFLRDAFGWSAWPLAATAFLIEIYLAVQLFQALSKSKQGVLSS
jgi:hypothetical protein